MNNFKKSYIKILTTKSKEEKDIIYNNCMYKKIQTLRGEISYPSYFLTIEYYKEHEIAFVSDLVHLKDKEYK
ncbi:MAG: hypothetical protein ACXW1A_03545 [Nitrososphaeraceae archaeon]